MMLMINIKSIYLKHHNHDKYDGDYYYLMELNEIYISCHPQQSYVQHLILLLLWHRFRNLWIKYQLIYLFLHPPIEHLR